MYYIDPHIHMVSRVTDDYETLAKMGCVAMSEPAFWAGFDRGSVDAGLTKDLHYARETAMPQWKDKEAISKTYVAAIATGTSGGADTFARVYGASALFHPQLAVTRAQAAVLVSVIGDHTFYGGATRSAANPPAAPTAQPT